MQDKYQVKTIHWVEARGNLHWQMEVVAKLEMQTSHGSRAET